MGWIGHRRGLLVGSWVARSPSPPGCSITGDAIVALLLPGLRRSHLAGNPPPLARRNRRLKGGGSTFIAVKGVFHLRVQVSRRVEGIGGT